VTVAAGAAHTCAVLLDGSTVCWGSNSDGQLGDGTITGSTRPVQVKNLGGAVALATGARHSCALTSEGYVHCWGWNGVGQLGNGSTTNASTPVRVMLLAGVTAIAAGAAHTCALISDGSIRCWGSNSDGQLGASTADSSTPVPVRDADLRGNTRLAAGYYHNCAVNTGSVVRCWGANNVGQLAGAELPPISAALLVVPAAQGARAVAAGSQHSCAAMASGVVLCWGSNNTGAAQATVFSNARPFLPISLAGITAVVAGEDHTCAIVPGGEVQCWGRNTWGQLGNGSTIGSDTPVPVTGVRGATVLTTGASHTCAVVPGGLVLCWGSNGDGRLGSASPVMVTTPVPVTR
jgi:alpha-tubulin suppressor-like RCC1 family protein